MTDCTQHVSHRPYNGDALMSMVAHTVFYYPGDQALLAIQEVYLTSFDWIQAFSYDNKTSSPVTRTITTTRGQVTTSGSEVSQEFGLGVAFKGISMHLGPSRKSFTSQELSNVTSVETEITFEPHKITYYFQRRYKFRTFVWYICDAWNELSRVGGMGNYNPTYSAATDEIMSEDYLLTNVAPQGTGYVDASPIYSVPMQSFKWNRQLNNVTARAKNYLNDLARRNMVFISGYNARSTLADGRVEAVGLDDSDDKGDDHPHIVNGVVESSATEASSDAPSP